MKHSYNCYGDSIDDIELMLSDETFGHYDSGDLIIHWLPEDEYVDRYGFDKKNVEKNGLYVENVVIPRGTHLCRYGTNQGRMTTLAGTDYEYLSLPYKRETVEYHEYVVTADGISVKCIVTRGRAYKMFDSEGGAVQFLHPRRIYEEVKTGRIKESMEWLKKKKWFVKGH